MGPGIPVAETELGAGGRRGAGGERNATAVGEVDPSYTLERAVPRFLDRQKRTGDGTEMRMG